MSHPDYLREYVMKILPENLDGYIIIDACCGLGQWGFDIRTRKKGTPSIIGVDIYQPYIETLEKLSVYDQLYNDDINYFFENEILMCDVIILIECLEHLSKDDAQRLLLNVDGKAKLIIASTPKDFVQTKNITKENPYNYHKSGDYRDILIGMGYEEIKLDIGLHIQFFLKNIYIRLTGRNIDSITTLWVKGKC